jgi:ankyrin repeat protein
MAEAREPFVDFVEAACAPLDGGHATGTLERAQAILAAHPELAVASIHAAAILGDAAGVRRFLAGDSGSAVRRGGPRGWDPLTHLCFSRYLRLDRARSDAFVRAAAALLDAGASPNTGFAWDGEFESAIYGAAGVAHHAGLTRLLLERGADPNDGETAYHAPEGHDNAALELLVESGRLTADSLTLMLARKHDWHDRDGVRFLLEHGALPNRASRWGRTALHQALVRDNALPIIELLLQHGADPSLECNGQSAFAMAARAGRGDVLELLARRGLATQLGGVVRLIAACATNDAALVRRVAEREPRLVAELLEHGGELLAEFAGVGNTEGVRLLLDLGVPVDARFEKGDGYFDVAKDSTALHVAAWRAWPATVKLLIERGASVAATDAQGRTPLLLAVRACVDSNWTDRRSPESVAALLEAGASVSDAPYPCGYAEVDELVRSRRRTQAS